MKNGNDLIMVNAGKFLQESAAGLGAIGLQPIIRSFVEFETKKGEWTSVTHRDLSPDGSSIANPFGSSATTQYFRDEGKEAYMRQWLSLVQKKTPRGHRCPLEYEVFVRRADNGLTNDLNRFALTPEQREEYAQWCDMLISQSSDKQEMASSAMLEKLGSYDIPIGMQDELHKYQMRTSALSIRPWNVSTIKDSQRQLNRDYWKIANVLDEVAPRCK